MPSVSYILTYGPTLNVEKLHFKKRKSFKTKAHLPKNLMGIDIKYKFLRSFETDI